ncbi:thiamine pyrophosphate-binding protein [Parasulfitobacter algicola]|uniref:Thiamine pyrophosphate-binding protein n=1 Tax=Parasulfitobacter algicola TaxID=2614809 RepID=A0ABX2IM79_9RHOB|nr:thiamine pyrophosphate-binding protein [Sulfitobacter algicola]NSX53982.1 thiamine pyrophosphate-binding protein [Sulfitobacter algicola]
MKKDKLRHGGKCLVEQLAAFGVKRVFSVPGESFLPVLDGLYDSQIENIVCRHEGGAAMMAEAHGKLTGIPGIAFVTRGPGATNASCGVHIARQDSTPMILFVGQIARGHRDREAFQEVDYRAMFAPLAKWVAEIDDADRLPEYIGRAFHVAQSGRPGPVVLALPEDVLTKLTAVNFRSAPAPELPHDLFNAAEKIADRLSHAKRPLIIVGGPHWTAQAARDLEVFAQAHDLPVATGFRRQDYIDNRHSNYAGDLSFGTNPKLAARVRDSDCLLVLGSRLGDVETGGYTLINPDAPGKTIIHVHADADELGRVYRPDLAVTCDAPALISALVAVPGNATEERAKHANADYLAWRAPAETPGDMKFEQVVSGLSDMLPDDAIITNGAGNYAAWVHRYFQFKTFRSQLAPTSGSMGYGFPAAIAAKLENPDKTVVCFAGDGCFQMTLNEMSTAAQHGAAVIVIVVNNGRYGTIRMHQEKTYPARVSGTDLANPDFATLARAYGGHGEVIEKTDDFFDAFQRAQASGKLSVIELKVDPEALSPGLTLSQARAMGAS